jgi:hypothetical protein
VAGGEKSLTFSVFSKTARQRSCLLKTEVAVAHRIDSYVAIHDKTVYAGGADHYIIRYDLASSKLNKVNR